ncbi:hypothetical protein DPMN_075463 [Dreissena polymorpha]|uniref:Uncharacterized protein n=1 Tax=Dreissena polymorpha TaxID=45954 RepID=A0A9D3YH30_DREPO|nr:hypothetical protein DPMN_075463 [Dreissena polymorpha]
MNTLSSTNSPARDPFGMAMAMISKPLTCGKNIPGLRANPSMASKKYREDLSCQSRSNSVSPPPV